MPLVQIGNRTVDLERGDVVGFGVLAQRELSLLRYLLERPDQVISPEELLREVWGFAKGVRTRAVYTSVYRLRTLLEDNPNEPRILLAERGGGYRFLLPQRRTPFPTPVDDLVGRQDALADLGCLLETSRLVAVVGAPGIGKTRLVLHLGAQWCQRGSDVIWLPRVQGCGLIVSLAAALGLPAAEDGPVALSTVREVLAARAPCLLVADDMDEVDPSGRVVLSSLVESLPGLRVLVASRSPLELEGESVFELGPLDRPASEALLLARIGIDPQRTREDERAIARLAERLEGIPLAIDLAAASARLLGVAALVPLLDQSLGALRLADDARPGLSSAIERSWVALSTEQQRQLVYLAVFRGGFSVVAAEGLLGGEALRAITLLRRRSLLALGEGGRFSMFDVVREGIRCWCSPELWAEASLQHALWMKGWLSELHRSELPDTAHVIAADLLNVAAAVDTFATRGLPSEACAVLADVSALRAPQGDLQEMLGYAQRGLTLAPDEPTRIHFEMLRVRAMRLAYRLDEALLLARRAEVSARTSDPVTRFDALQSLIQCCVVAGEQREAERAAASLEALAPELDEARQLAAKISCARVSTISAHPEQAISTLEALEPRLQESSENVRTFGHVVRAFALMRTDPQRAEIELERLETHSRARGWSKNAEHLALARAHLLLRCARAPEAARLLDGLEPVSPSPLMQLLRAWIAWEEQSLQRCEATLREAAQLAHSLGDAYGESLATAALAQLARGDGRPAEAIALLGRSSAQHPGHARENAAWVVAIQCERDPRSSEAIRALDHRLAGTICARRLAGESGPMPVLSADHELVDRMGVDLTAARLARRVHGRSGA